MKDCQGVCERDIHADNGEAAPKCSLSVGHDKTHKDGKGYIEFAMPCICWDCAMSDVAAAESYYETYGR